MHLNRLTLSVICLCLLSAEAHAADSDAEFGTNVSLDAPRTSFIPTISITNATGWPTGAAPIAANGFVVNAIATQLDHPRWLYVLPNGDVLVAETNAPPKPDDARAIKGYIMGRAQKRAGAVLLADDVGNVVWRVTPAATHH